MPIDNVGLRDTFTTLRGLKDGGRRGALNSVIEDRIVLGGNQSAQATSTEERLRGFDLGSSAADQQAIAADQNLQALEARRIVNPRQTANNLFSLVGQQGGFGAALGAGIASARADFADLVNSRIDDASKRLGRFREDRVLQRDLRQSELQRERLASQAGADAVSAEIAANEVAVGALSEGVKAEDQAKKDALNRQADIEISKIQAEASANQGQAIAIERIQPLIQRKQQALGITPESQAQFTGAFNTLQAGRTQTEGDANVGPSSLAIAAELQKNQIINEIDGTSSLDPAKLTVETVDIIGGAINQGGFEEIASLIPSTKEQVTELRQARESARIMLDTLKSASGKFSFPPGHLATLENTIQQIDAGGLNPKTLSSLESLYQLQDLEESSIASFAKGATNNVPESVRIGAQGTTRTVTNGQ